MKYSIVIPTYNHCDDLLKPCIETVFRYSNIADIELIVSANGCTDNTFEYLGDLKEKFTSLGLSENMKIAWDSAPLGYAKATNAGIKLATTDLIILLNNDILLLEQRKNQWLEMLAAQFADPLCGISCLIYSMSAPAGRKFAVFFCVMVHRKVFDKIGLLSLDYGMGGGEDTEFCIEAENAGFTVNEAVTKQWSSGANMFVGDFPIYHKGEGTVHDVNLVPNWTEIFDENSRTLARKYNPEWLKLQMSNNAERGIFLKNDTVFAREQVKYKFAGEKLIGNKILEIGCSSGYGLQFLPKEIDYLGIDKDQTVIQCAIEQDWRPDAKFVSRDITELTAMGHFVFNEHYDTVIMFETIEHLAYGIPFLNHIKKFVDKIIFSVPYNESPGQFSPHHVLHNLTKDSFPDCTEIGLIDFHGKFVSYNELQPGVEYSLLMVWEIKNPGKNNHVRDLFWLKEQHAEIFEEVINRNQYVMTPDNMLDRNVLDIGANIGAASLMAAYKGAKKIVAVEPVSSTFNSFLTNIARSGFTNIVPKRRLVTNIAGEFHEVSVSNVNTGHNSMYNTATNAVESVETTTLSDLLSEFEGGNVFLKLDCEGAEYDIILNATDEDMVQVTDIAVELHTDLHPVYKGHEIIQDKLLKFGFIQTDAKQVHVWSFSPDGQVTECKPIPYRLETWRK